MCLDTAWTLAVAFDVSIIAVLAAVEEQVSTEELMTAQELMARLFLDLTSQKPTRRLARFVNLIDCTVHGPLITSPRN